MRKRKHKPYKLNIPCAGCESPQRKLSTTKGNVYCKRCKRAKGENHHKWKDGSFIDRAGYRMILVNDAYYREHRLVWQRANNASLLTNGTIHHIRMDLDHNKIYNDPDNLVLVSDKEHGSFHRLYDAKRYNDAFAVLVIAAKRQLHYPKELDNIMDSVLGNAFYRCV